MSLQQHEKWIKENIGKAQIEVNNEELWNDLIGHLPQKRKNRKVFLLLFFCLGFTAISLFYLFSKNSETPIEVIDIVELNEDSVNQIEIIKNERSSFSIAESEVIKLDEGNIINEEIDIEEQRKAHFSNGIGLTEFIRGKNAILFQRNNFSFLKSTDLLNENIIEVETNDGNIIISNNDLIEKNTSLLNTTLLENSTPNPAVRTDKFSLPVLIPTVLDKKNKWHIGVFNGVNFASYNFDMLPVEIRDDYGNITDNLIGYSSALNVYYDLNNKISFVGGINYSQIVSRFTYSFNEVGVSIVDGIKKILIDVNGVASEVEGEVLQYTISETTGKWHLNENLIEFNLGSDYVLFNKNRFRTAVGLGINTPLYNNIEGKGLSYQDENLIINSISEKLQVLNNISTYGSIDLQYRLSSDVNIGIKGSCVFKQNTNYTSIPNFKRTRYAVGLSITRVLNY